MDQNYLQIKLDKSNQAKVDSWFKSTKEDSNGKPVQHFNA